MSKRKFYTFLCLLGLTGNSNGIERNENDVSITKNNNVLNSNKETDQKKKSKNLKKKIEIGLPAALAGILGISHLVIHGFLYPGILAKPARRKSLPKNNGFIWATYELKNGGSAVIRIPKENNEIKSVWICFPGNGYDGVGAIKRAVYERRKRSENSKNIVFIGIDYPGYGSGNWSWLNASRLSNVASEVVDYACEKYRDAKINVYAHSLGGYPASSLMDRDNIENFCLHSPVRLDTVILKSKFLTYALNWENLSYIDNMLDKIPKRKTKCNVFIISGGHIDEYGEFLSLYDTLPPTDGKKIKEKLIDTGKLNLQCKIHRKDNHSSWVDFFDTNDLDLKNYDILTGKAEGDQ